MRMCDPFLLFIPQHPYRITANQVAEIHRPAEDCLLKPDDVQKWRLEEPVTIGDKWTRGQHALPVYAEARGEEPVPEYQVDADDQVQPTGNQTMTTSDDKLSEAWDGRDTMQNTQSIGTPNNTAAPAQYTQPSAKTIADGKTAEQIIAEAKAKPRQKMTWKEKFSKGATMAMMGL